MLKDHFNLPLHYYRVDAIRGAEEERLTQIANRTNPLDDELIKTKGLLRCPSLRSMKGDRRKSKQEKEGPSVGPAAEKDSTMAAMDQSLPLAASTSPPETSATESLLPSSTVPAVTEQVSSLASLSALSCLHDKANAAAGAEADSEMHELEDNALSDAVLPSPAQPCNQCSATAASVPVEAFYEFQSGGEMASISNGPIVKSNDFGMSDKSSPPRHALVSPACSSKEDIFKALCEETGSGIDSYVSLAAHAEFTSKYLNESNAHAAGAQNGCSNSKKVSPSMIVSSSEQSSQSTKNEGSRKERRFQRDDREKTATSAEARKELLKDVENFKKKENLTSALKQHNCSGDGT